MDRRRLALFLLATLCASGCDRLVRVDQKPRLRRVRISLPPEQTPALLAMLDEFAQRRGFVFSSDRVSSREGTSTHFSLSRADVRIVGLNPLKEDIEIVRSREGTPEAVAEIDEGTLEVSFFAARRQPTERDLNALVLDFIATVETVERVAAEEAR